MLRRVALVRTDVSEGTQRLLHQGEIIGEQGTTLAITSNRRTLRRMRRLLVTASVVPSSPILVTLMKKALSSYETSVLTRATRRNIPEDAILNVKLNTLNAQPVSAVPRDCEFADRKKRDIVIEPQSVRECARS
jgi:hypothetical protein